METAGRHFSHGSQERKGANDLSLYAGDDQRRGYTTMSKASEYADQFPVKQPKFMVHFENGEERTIFYITQDGRIALNLYCELGPKDALRLRDWITENFE
jgi:hypothetical protein